MESRSVERAQLVTRIRDALANGEGELGIRVDVERDVITLTGVVQTEERRRRVEELSRLVCTGYSIVNHIAVCPPGAPNPPEQIS
jgi:osmotically-inducible protein OsmY